MLAASLMLGGMMPLDAHTRAQWPAAGAWRMPVGDAYTMASSRPQRPGSFFVLRSVEWDGARAAHQGADLGCGEAGLPVEAAAAGLVVSAQDRGDFGGYGTHVVLAHRLAGGVLAYTVYAHMMVASLRVHAGQCVQAGRVLGRVGMTGHATGPHLHFEVRTAENPGERWEFARVEDPLAFIDERLPAHRADTTGAEAVLEWGETAALLPLGVHAEDVLTRADWWRMLAADVKGPLFDPALEPRALRDRLIEAHVLPADAATGHTGVPASWQEVARDLARIRRLGVRSGNAPLRKALHREVCETVLGTPTPAVHTGMLSGRVGRPTLAQAVVMLADVAGPQPEPPPPPKPVRIGPHGRSLAARTGLDSVRAHPTRADSLRRAHAAATRGSLARRDSTHADSTLKPHAALHRPAATLHPRPARAESGRADSAGLARPRPNRARAKRAAADSARADSVHF